MRTEAAAEGISGLAITSNSPSWQCDRSRYFAIGDAGAIVDRIAAYVAAGISKFILRPAARGDEEMLSQTRRLIEEVLPLVASRWPNPVKARAAHA